VIDCVRGKIVAPVATVLTARRFAIWERSAPAVTPQHGVSFATARSFAAEPVDPPVSASAPFTPPSADMARHTAEVARQGAEGAKTESAAAVEPPARNVAGGLSIARQLGLGVSRIVIDAGHGGHDPGAQGRGVTEAELVLDVALRLEKLLQRVPGLEVILTRRTDEFIALPERTAIANREAADLFLSIHANANTHAQAHGIETYFLNFANNQSAAAVAARENATSAQAMGALPDFVKAIALTNKLDESRDSASQVQRAMVTRLRASNKALRDLGVKQAPFVVLIGAVMPSVLAEISFVTNPQEARLLKGTVYRQRISEALFNAIRKYQTSLKNVTTVAPQ
jgi:N-acetylmuramoyl-L-alanine amidase